MADELEGAISAAVETLRAEGFEQDYINAALTAYRESLDEECKKAAEHGMLLAASPLSKVTSVASVDDPYPKESIGWQHRPLKQGEAAPGGWIIVNR